MHINNLGPAYKTPTNAPTNSRSDAFFGNNHVFNQSIFDTSTAYWTTDILTPKQIANSKLARQVTSRAYNPDYTFTTTTEEFSLGEVAAPFIVFGTLQDPTVEKNLVTYFFGTPRPLLYQEKMVANKCENRERASPDRAGMDQEGCRSHPY